MDHRSYRPDWIDTLPVPRVVPDTSQMPMSRLDGRRLVRPFATRFPPEERQVYYNAAWPWGLIGKVFTNTRPGGAGSGVLVGPRLVVTAAHVLPGTGDWWMRFVPAYWEGASLHGAAVESYVSDTRAFAPGGVCGYDWALLRLYEPLGSWLGFMGTNGYDDDWEDRAYWSIAGYPAEIERGQRPSYQSGVSVFDDDSDDNGGQELETRADLGPGNSGGPMFGWWGEDVPRLGSCQGRNTTARSVAANGAT